MAKTPPARQPMWESPPIRPEANRPRRRYPRSNPNRYRGTPEQANADKAALAPFNDAIRAADAELEPVARRLGELAQMERMAGDNGRIRYGIRVERAKLAPVYRELERARHRAMVRRNAETRRLGRLRAPQEPCEGCP